MTRSDGDPLDDQATMASMADLKLMETSLISSMDTKFAEMRELIKELASGKVPKEITPLDDSATSHDGDTEEGKEEKKGLKIKKPTLRNLPPLPPLPKVGSRSTMGFPLRTLPTHLSIILG